MNNNYSNPNSEAIEEMVKRMTLIFFALLAGIVSFLIVSIYLVELEKSMGTSDFDTALLIVVPVMSIGCVAGSYIVSGIQLKEAKNSNGEKMILHYQTAYLIRYALIEGPSLFSTVSYMITGNRLFLVFLAVLVGIMILNKPSLSKFKEEMGELR